jgi:Na+-translocating ferredoxin:NAD+ oxidoreductase RnfD subunit
MKVRTVCPKCGKSERSAWTEEEIREQCRQIVNSKKASPERKAAFAEDLRTGVYRWECYNCVMILGGTPGIANRRWHIPVGVPLLFGYIALVAIWAAVWGTLVAPFVALLIGVSVIWRLIRRKPVPDIAKEFEHRIID